MLRSLAIENWKSIDTPVEFSMLATRERKFGHRLASIHGQRGRTLPVAAIFGANASGKSAFVKALAYLQRLVTTPRNKNEGPLPPKPHLARGADRDTSFLIEFTATIAGKDQTYLYEVSLNKRTVTAEILHLLRPTIAELIFERVGDQNGFSVDLHPRLEELRPLVRQMMAPGKLLLTEFGELAEEPELIAPALGWFRNTLQVLSKDSIAYGFKFHATHNEALKGFVSGLLSQADTGIRDLKLEPLDPQSVPVLRDEDRAILERGNGAFTIELDNNDVIFVTNDNGNVVYSKLVAEHAESDCEFKLDFGEESDGTRRYFDLIPALIALNNDEQPAVFVVDELDHSLHPALTERLILSYLAGCSTDSRHQLIFTTHELALLSAGILRRDEIWRFEKINGHTDMARFSDYSYDGARDGADLVRLYMSGRLGGVPRSY